MIGRGFKHPTYEVERSDRERGVRLIINGEYVMDGVTGKPTVYDARQTPPERLQRLVTIFLHMA